jgi:hypothetical protein
MAIIEKREVIIQTLKELREAITKNAYRATVKVKKPGRVKYGYSDSEIYGPY